MSTNSPYIRDLETPIIPQSFQTVPKTLNQLEKHLENSFLAYYHSPYPYNGFMDEYFDMTPQDQLPQCLFPLLKHRRLSGDGRTGAGRGPLGEGHGTGAATAPYPPITNRGATLYTSPDPDSEQLGTPQLFTTCPGIMGGYDGGVEVGFNGTWQPGTFDEAAKFLEEGLKVAQSRGSDRRFLQWNGRRFKFRPFGGGKGVHYRYIIEGAGMKISIHSHPDGDLQPLRIRYGAEALIGRNLFNVHKNFRNWLQDIGFHVEKETVSRVDMQVMLERPVENFFRLINSGHVMTKAGKWATHGRYGKAETFSLGSDIEICIYDKGRETSNMMASNPVKFLLMLACCFGEEWLVEQRPITRVEFRLRRDALKVKGVNTMRDLQEIEPTLVEWLTTRWFRILKDKKRRGRENRQEIAPLWREVQQRFREYFPGVDGVRREIIPLRKRPLACSAEQLLKQATGCVASALAILQGGTENEEQAGRAAAKLMESFRERIFERSNERAAELAVIGGE